MRLMGILNRVFNRDNMGRPLAVNPVHQRRQSGGFAGPSRTGNQDQAARVLGKFIDHLRQPQIFYGANNIWYETHGGRQVATFMESVNPKASQVTESETEIKFLIT